MTDDIKIEGASAVAYRVTPGSAMALAGYGPGWYWEHVTAKEPHGPFDTFEEAREDALHGDESPR